MRWATLFVAMFVVGCGEMTNTTSPPVPTPSATPEPLKRVALEDSAVMALASVPAAEIGDHIPKLVQVCWGLHYGVLSERDKGSIDPALARDMYETCRGAAIEVGGGCRAYAVAAWKLGKVALSAKSESREWIEAENAAEDAISGCEA